MPVESSPGLTFSSSDRQLVTEPVTLAMTPYRSVSLIMRENLLF